MEDREAYANKCSQKIDLDDRPQREREPSQREAAPPQREQQLMTSKILNVPGKFGNIKKINKEEDVRIIFVQL